MISLIVIPARELYPGFRLNCPLSFRVPHRLCIVLASGLRDSGDMQCHDAPLSRYGWQGFFVCGNLALAQTAFQTVNAPAPLARAQSAARVVTLGQAAVAPFG